MEQGLLSTPQAEEEHGKTNEAATVRLVRTSCKAFAAGADEKSGVYGQFRIFAKEFLHHHHLHSLPIIPFRGSRLNILFDNAAGMFFLREQMLQFLQPFGAENRLTKVVLCDIQVPELLASCKALGLVGRLVTQPLWSVIEKKDVNVLPYWT